MARWMQEGGRDKLIEIDDSILGKVSVPALLAVNYPLKPLGDACDRWAFHRLTVRWLRGKRMRTTQGLYDEFSAALQFPPYFRNDMATLDKCLSDLEWIEFTSMVVVVFDADQVLVNESDHGLTYIERCFIGANKRFSMPANSKGKSRSARPFHGVLQMSEEESHRWVNGLETIRQDAGILELTEPETELRWLQLN